MKKLVIAAIVLGPGLDLAPRVHADEVGYTCKKLAPDSKVRVSLKPGLPLAELVTWVMTFTCKTVIYDEALSRRAPKVTIVSPNEMTAKEAYQLFLDSLAVYDVTATEKGNTLVLQEHGRSVTPPTPAEEPPLPDYDKYIKKIDDLHYQIARELIDRVLAEPSEVARSGRIVPSIKDGKANGFKIYAIRPSSIWARVGLQNGDTIVAVNGLEISTPDKALEVYTKLKGADHLELALVRRGNPVTLVLTISK